MPGNSQAGLWWQALLLLLLGAAFVVPALGREVFDSDEASTMINAGARHLGPYTPAAAVARSLTRSPDQAWGQAVVYALWGQVFGWSELAIRTLPWFSGLLSLAWLYRLGRSLFTPRVALAAMLLLATSIVFLTYMQKARSYGPAILFATLCLWAWWRVALHPRAPGRGAHLALVTGATGLLYTNYFCALLLPALALFHLLFVRKDRRWWQPVLLLGLATLLALPQVPDLLAGIAHNQAKEHLHAEALRPPEILTLLLRYLGNGLIVMQQPLATLLLPALTVLLLFAVWRSHRCDRPPHAVLYLALTSMLQFLLLLLANEWLRVFEEKRIRYLVTLWPPLLLLISLALVQFSRLRPWGTAGSIALVTLLAFTGARDVVQGGELSHFSWLRSETPVSIAATRAIAAEGDVNGLLVVDKSGLFDIHHRIHDFYTGFYDERRARFKKIASPEALLDLAQERDLVWLLYRSAEKAGLQIYAYLDFFRQQGWFHCRAMEGKGVSLDLLLPPFLPSLLEQPRLQFAGDVQLFAPDTPELRAGHLRLKAGLSSTDPALPARYSLALHIIDSHTGERVAQGDTGVGAGTWAPVCREIDLSTLPPGDYEVHVALYDWRTGERLSALDPGTGVNADIHVLYRIQTSQAPTDAGRG